MATKTSKATTAMVTPEPETTTPVTAPTSKTKIANLVADGKTRSEIAKALGMSYQAVYLQTRDAFPDSGPIHPKVILDDGVARADRIRELFANGNGLTRGAIAKQLGITYQVVFAATKTKKAARATQTGIVAQNTTANAGTVVDSGEDSSAEDEPFEFEEADEAEAEETTDESLLPV
jgi:hypothetical protein